MPLAALRLTRCPAGHSTAGISPETQHGFASLCFLPSPLPVTAVPGLCTAVDEHGMGFKQARPSGRGDAGTTADNPRSCLSGSVCCSCFGEWGEHWPSGSAMLVSNSFYAQNKSFSTGYCWTHTGSDAVSTASAFGAAAAIWKLSAFWGKGLGLSRLRLVILAALCLLAFFIFQILLGYFPQIPILLFELLCIF